MIQTRATTDPQNSWHPPMANATRFSNGANDGALGIVSVLGRPHLMAVHGPDQAAPVVQLGQAAAVSTSLAVPRGLC